MAFLEGPTHVSTSWFTVAIIGNGSEYSMSSQVRSSFQIEPKTILGDNEKIVGAIIIST